MMQLGSDVGDATVGHVIRQVPFHLISSIHLLSRLENKKGNQERREAPNPFDNASCCVRVH